MEAEWGKEKSEEHDGDFQPPGIKAKGNLSKIKHASVKIGSPDLSSSTLPDNWCMITVADQCHQNISLLMLDVHTQ